MIEHGCPWDLTLRVGLEVPLGFQSAGSQGRRLRGGRQFICIQFRSLDIDVFIKVRTLEKTFGWCNIIFEYVMALKLDSRRILEAKLVRGHCRSAQNGRWFWGRPVPF